MVHTTYYEIHTRGANGPLTLTFFAEGHGGGYFFFTAFISRRSDHQERIYYYQLLSRYERYNLDHISYSTVLYNNTLRNRLRVFNLLTA